ncbi:GAF domain-containing sensor histidine kinase [Maricaulis sp.]|uniref:GAF domain-containing sensor histidine kinase n=1 Tax=Maricaulis sp. TaxID=1486257 RepID=UPI001B234C0A|nr:GAF domain-containing sensor histidine kinase [Maricaulis sp.]MBO6797085.1 GAF domain-containing sensor histidine kinase [Maricaulis sp.]
MADIVERSKNGQARQSAHFNRELDRLTRFRLEENPGIDRLLEEVVRSLSTSVGAERASIWILDNQHVELGCLCLYDQNTSEISSGATLKASDYPAYFEAFRCSRVVNADDAVTDPRTCEFAVGYLDVLGITSMLDTQISDRKGLRGVVCCEHVGPAREWSEEECAFVASLGDFVGLSMELFEREKIARALERSNERLVEALAEAERAKAEAEAANRLKTQFLANTSHELRTPLNGILGGVSILQHDHSPEALERWLGVIDSSGRWLLNTVATMLDLASLEDGSITLKVERFNLLDAVREGAQLGLPPAADVPVPSVGVETLPVSHLELKTDRSKLLQIIANFVSNAHKFAPQRVMRIDLSPSPEREDAVRISVIDNGKGVPEGDQAEIFERFRQGDGSPTRRFGGSGLGLSVCKAFARLLGGDVGVFNTPQGGAQFWVDIPLEIDTPVDTRSDL